MSSPPENRDVSDWSAEEFTAVFGEPTNRVSQPTFNPAYRVARCGDSSSHGPHVVDHGPDQPRNCPGSGRYWRWEPDGNGGWISAPRCCEPTCPDFGSWDFGEGTCPAEHAERLPPAAWYARQAEIGHRPTDPGGDHVSTDRTCPNCPPGYNCWTGNYYTGDVHVAETDPYSFDDFEEIRDEQAARRAGPCAPRAWGCGYPDCECDRDYPCARLAAETEDS